MESEIKYSLEAAYQKASRILQHDSIKETGFVDLYGSENVVKDTELASHIKTKQEQRDTPEAKESAKLASVLEAIIHTQVNNSKWFGNYAKSIKAPQYDDLINGVDTVIEFKVPQIPTHYLAMGIDVTYRINLEKKFERIKQEIDDGQLATIKYLRSSDGTMRAEKTQVPRLVIGVDGQTCQSLAKAWYEEAPGLKTNPVKFQIIKELHMQLVAFEQYARKTGKKDIAEKYKESLSVVEPLLREVEKQYHFKNEVGDRSTTHIEEALREF